MGRAYNVIDADGHILEPVDMWDNYMDPTYRARAPRMFVDSDGKERLNIDGKIIGGPRGLGRLGGIGPRDGRVPEDMKYSEGYHGRGCGNWGKALPFWRSWAEVTGTSERVPLQKRRWSG